MTCHPLASDTRVVVHLDVLSDGDSDVIMLETERQREAIDIMSDLGSDVSVAASTEIVDQDQDEVQFEFESAVPTIESDNESHVPLPQRPQRPPLHRLPRFDELTLAATEGGESEVGHVINPQDADQCSVDQALDASAGFANGENNEDGDEDVDDDDNDSDSTESWEWAWRLNPTIDPDLFAVPMPVPPSDPSGPVPLDRNVIRVIFVHSMTVEMRFSPGLRSGAPVTRILSRHVSHVSTNF